MLRTGLSIPSPLTPCYFHIDASFISRLAITDDIDRPIYGLSAHTHNLIVIAQKITPHLKFNFQIVLICETMKDNRDVTKGSFINYVMHWGVKGWQLHYKV